MGFSVTALGASNSKIEAMQTGFERAVQVDGTHFDLYFKDGTVIHAELPTGTLTEDDVIRIAGEYFDSHKSEFVGLSDLDGTTIYKGDDGKVHAQGGGGGTSNYESLTNKPSINGVTLSGNKTLAQIGVDTEIASYVTTHKSELKGDKGDDGKNYSVLINSSSNINVEVTLNPNQYYQYEEVASLYFDLAEPTDTTILNEYMLEFKSGSVATDFSYDVSSITFESDVTIEPNKIYQLSVVNGVALIVGVDYE